MGPTMTLKRYACKSCGHETTQSTNHYGSTWSEGRYNTCPNCPPHAKYPEYGGATIWLCLEQLPKEEQNG
jgi:DNA-directed RNA polymerase subunit RPC12/RpoP